MTDSGEPNSELHDIFATEWEAHLRLDPLFATITGDRRFNDRLPEISPARYEEEAELLRRGLRRLEAIDRSALSAGDRLNADVFRRLKRDALQEIEFQTFLMPLGRTGGYHTLFAEVSGFVSFERVGDYEDYLARLDGYRAFHDGHVDLMREGLRLGLTQPRVALEGTQASVEGLITEDPERNPLFKPFLSFGEAVGGADRRRLAAEAHRRIESSVVPAHRDLLRFLEQEYLPGARATIAASDLPNGRAFYEHRVRMNTTLDVTPEAVHAIGQDEVRRIAAEMQAVRDRVGHTGDAASFGARLREDPRFFAETPGQLLKEVAYVLKRMDGELPRLFRRLPRLPYGIQPVPDYLAPQTTTAYYWEGAGDGTRAGTYYVNTYDLKSRPLYEIEALSLHEAVPGHHLQIALQQELTGLPNFRRFEGFTALVEGWALYAERLGLEVGFYTDPFSDYGRLTYEMWRACRLVVDTGMHALGWTRSQAIDFVIEHTALTELNVRNEIDRYLSWPGQALAYKMGELKIRELRRAAEAALGERFAVRAFHDALLQDGAVPLDVLESRIRAWISEAGRAPGG
jgi:uncharacterized protein (DUF885 family)